MFEYSHHRTHDFPVLVCQKNCEGLKTHSQGSMRGFYLVWTFLSCAATGYPSTRGARSLTVKVAAANQLSDSRIGEALDYAVSLRGCLYKYWRVGDPMLGDFAPFYSSNGKPPSENQIREGGLNCAGLVNLVRRNAGLDVPGVEQKYQYAGGTYAWFRHLRKTGYLIPLRKRDNGIYAAPPGSLLLRPYKNEQDQGHMALVCGLGGLTHAYSSDFASQGPLSIGGQTVKRVLPLGLQAPGVVAYQDAEIPHSWHGLRQGAFRGYFTHWCPPAGWLLSGS